MDLADAVSPSEKCGSEWLSSSWSGSMRKRVLRGEGSGVRSKADDMASCQVREKVDTVTEVIGKVIRRLRKGDRAREKKKKL